MNWQQLVEQIQSSNGLIGIVIMLAITSCLTVILLLLRSLYDNPLRDVLDETAQRTDAGDEEGAVGSLLMDSLASQLPSPTTSSSALDVELRRAGFYKPTAKRDYLALRNLFIVLAVLFTGAIVVLLGPDRQEVAIRVLITGLIVAAMGWAIPRLILRSRGEARVQRIRQGLPNALDMISMCMSGGLALGDSLKHVSREMYDPHPDLAVELLFVRYQSEMSSLAQALQQFANRIDAEEIVSMAALVGQGQRLGTGLVASLQDYSDAIRSKWRYTADERAGKAAVKLLLPVAFCLMPAIFIIMWGPSVMELWEFMQQFEGASGGIEALENANN